MRGLFAQASSVAFFALSCLGCSGDGTPKSEPPECDSKCEAEKDDSGSDSDECLDVPSFEEVAGFAKCRQCHDSSLTGVDRNGAPAAYNFDDYDVASGLADRIAMLVAREEMPPASSGVTVTDTQRAELVTWAMCGAPP